MDGFHFPGVLRAGFLLFSLAAGGMAAASPRLDDIEARLRGRPDAGLAELATLLDATQGEERVEALVLRGALQQRLADAEGLEGTAQALEALAREQPLAGVAAQLLRGMAWARQKPLGRSDRALSEGLAALPANAPPGLRLRFTAELAAVRRSLGKLDQAIALLQEAVQLADRENPTWRRAEQRSALAYALHLAHQLDRAQALNAEATALARQARDLHAQATAANVDAILYSALGRQADELRASQQAVDFARRAGARRLLALTTANLADFHLKRGEYAQALALAQQALPLAREIRDLSSESVALTNAGLAHIGLGRVDQGAALVRQALEIDERSSGLPGMAATQLEFGQALERAGRLQDAWAALTEHRRLADAVFQREHQQAVLELQEGFDAEARARELATLETDQRLKRAQLETQALQHRLWLIGLAAGVLLLAVVALMLRRLRLSNTALRLSNEALRRAGGLDPLTGLANRRQFHELMERSADLAFEGSMLLIDLDHFKRINDEHGHAAGDTVLSTMARRLQVALRPEDLIVRWGGEEFLVVVRGLPTGQVEALAQRLLAAVGDSPVEHEGSVVRVTASIGFATFPLPPGRAPTGWERAVDVVDTALYLAKAHGRNRAYGLRSLHPGADGAGVRLEDAWRDGHAELAQLAGPAVDGGPK